MKTLTYLFPVLLLGCTTTPVPTVVRVVQEPVQVSAKPWSDGQSVTYWLGRSTVGSDGLTMHEAHPVYRLENAAKPQLAAPAEVFYPTNPPTTNATIEQFEILRAEVARSRDLILRLTQASDALAQQAARFNINAEATRQLLIFTTTLSNRLFRIEEHILSLPISSKN